MFAKERHRAIIKLVREKRRLNFSDLSEAVSVSPATLRRDLAELEIAGELIRVHGGVLDPSYARSESSFDERMLSNHEAKRKIALAAQELIPAGASVFVDAGSTCLEAGKALLGRKDVTILTHSIALMAAGIHAEATLICLGGVLRKVSGALVGGGALGSLANLHADYALLGASGVTSEGCFTTELTEAEVKRAILDRSGRSILLCDTTKWQKSSVVKFANWTKITDWALDRPLPFKASAELRKAGVTFHLAS